jgi:hypothetical protein
MDLTQYLMQATLLACIQFSHYKESSRCPSLSLCPGFVFGLFVYGRPWMRFDAGLSVGHGAQLMIRSRSYKRPLPVDCGDSALE